MIVAQRLRKSATGSPRGSQRRAGDALKTVARIVTPGRPVLVRADSAFSAGPPSAPRCGLAPSRSWPHVGSRRHPAVSHAPGTDRDKER